ncbi:tRNA-Thr(GGU) m(6)t(6)A37 methyltransferase TsaA [Desulfuromusa kysingii]|uniref:tRNA-Thr(GGU) m(6)t(6)A37 methyltransferase TsaA n=1 Tax=Desulfuromusa kysingii TaxID=37625 RepID=A0A1H4CLX1_9BACT|nr:tRNA (N6-threonylcarbamoyladenosine(37)-N6)-methyltransferase TrmO [Desulfuromusa kysingii]SEA61313.1 tRNA-Thr(GGU) m(6)t(6)A37 methyltransferase TsaA [Desulfuromusa kysingii]
MMENRQFTPIGLIKTPYVNSAPYQPVANDEQEFYLQLDTEYVAGLKDLDSFHYIYVLYFIDRLKAEPKMEVTPPWAAGHQVGLFASRSPARPNPIGLSVVKVKQIQGDKVYTTGLDVFNNTPLLDIKPYIHDLDNKRDANNGWVAGLDEDDHLTLHIQGIPHDY